MVESKVIALGSELARQVLFYRYLNHLSSISTHERSLEMGNSRIFTTTLVPTIFYGRIKIRFSITLKSQPWSNLINSVVVDKNLR